MSRMVLSSSVLISNGEERGISETKGNNDAGLPLSSHLVSTYAHYSTQGDERDVSRRRVTRAQD